MLLALIKTPAESLVNCQLTFLDREPIHIEHARQQHQTYCQALSRAGAQVITLPPDEVFPDSVFVEDTALVLDEVAIITSPGAESRRGEVTSMATALQVYRPLQAIHLPATLEGGDILRVGQRLYAGLSTRTNAAGIQRLRDLTAPYGYDTTAVPVTGCLHLKTGCTALDDDTLLVNPAWIDITAFESFRIQEVDPEEPWGANVLRIGETILMNAASPRTIARVAQAGYAVLAVDIAEFMKAEAGLTCMSLIFEAF